MLHEGTCPKCGESVTHIKMETLPLYEGSRVRGQGVVLLCSHCNTVLGAGLDPDTSIAEKINKSHALTGDSITNQENSQLAPIEIPAKTDVHPESIPAHETSDETTAAQFDQRNPAMTRQVDWPIIRTQHELAEVAKLQHRKEDIYPLQGKPVGEILMHYGVIDERTLGIVRSIQKRPAYKNKPIGETLVEIGLLNQDELARTLLIQAGIPLVDILSIDISPEIIKTIPHATANEKLVVPIGNYHDKLYLAVSDPFTFKDQSFFTMMTGMKVSLAFAPSSEIVTRLKGA